MSRSQQRCCLVTLMVLSVVLLLGVRPAASQGLNHGSIAVIYFTKEKIVMAADSRGIENDRRSNDRECKVAALGNDVIFSVTGMLGYTPAAADLTGEWHAAQDAHVAHDAIATSRGTARGNLQEIATAWAATVQGHVQKLYRRYPELTSSVLERQSGLVAAGMFGGFDSTGGLSLVRGTITFDAANLTSPFSSQVTSLTCQMKNFCATGRTAIAEEFITLSSERAREEARTWTPASIRVVDYELLRAIRLVELTIRYGASEEVGTPIDAIELRKDGFRRWFARKPSCPEN